MTFGLHPVSNSTRPFGCSIRKDGHGRSSIAVASPPCISNDAGAVRTAPGSAHSLLTLPSAIALLELVVPTLAISLPVLFLWLDGPTEPLTRRASLT